MRWFRRREKHRRSFIDRLFRGIFLKRYGRNLLYDLQLQAKEESVAYVNERMRGVPYFEEADTILHHALRRVAVRGLYLEFGVAEGASISKIARRTSSTVHGFDSFEGLPEAWGRNPVGKFGQKGKLPRIPDNVELHVGWFADTLPKFLGDMREDIAFLHIDCDLYESTKTVLEHCKERLQPGTVILFDEYFNYPHWQEHEYRAFQEFVRENDVEYEYVAFSCVRTQAAAMVIANPRYGSPGIGPDPGTITV